MACFGAHHPSKPSSSAEVGTCIYVSKQKYGPSSLSTHLHIYSIHFIYSIHSVYSIQSIYTLIYILSYRYHRQIIQTIQIRETRETRETRGTRETRETRETRACIQIKPNDNRLVYATFLRVFRARVCFSILPLSHFVGAHSQ